MVLGKQVNVLFNTRPLSGLEMLRQRRHIARSVVDMVETEEEEGGGQVKVEEKFGFKMA